MALPAAAMVSPYGHTIPPVGANSAPTDCVGKRRFDLVNLLFVEYLQIRHTVLYAALVKLLHGFHVRVVKRDYKRTVRTEFYAKRLADTFHQTVALHIEFCFERAGMCVKTGVNNAAVGLGGAMATSFSFSSTQTFKRSRVSSRAVSAPTTPQPMTVTSYITIFLSKMYVYYRSAHL